MENSEEPIVAVVVMETTMMETTRHPRIIENHDLWGEWNAWSTCSLRVQTFGKLNSYAVGMAVVRPYDCQIDFVRILFLG